MAISGGEQRRREARKERYLADRAEWAKMSPAERRAKTYRDRNRLLRELGFKDYQTYLASNLWKLIRGHILEKNPRCWCCSAKATQVHHLRYTKAALLGKKPSLLRALCADCHEEAEFRKHDGEKLATYQANNKLGGIRHRKQASRAEREEQEQWLANRICADHQYLVRKNRPQVAHLWNGSDTACRMFSTGGMVPLKYGTVESPGDLRICQVCIANAMRNSRRDIESKKTVNGGWTKSQLAEWGVPWPPPNGWKDSLEAINAVAAAIAKKEDPK